MSLQADADCDRFAAHCDCRDPEAKLALEETAKDAVKTALRSASSHHRVPKETGQGAPPQLMAFRTAAAVQMGRLSGPRQRKRICWKQDGWRVAAALTLALSARSMPRRAAKASGTSPQPQQRMPACAAPAAEQRQPHPGTFLIISFCCRDRNCSLKQQVWCQSAMWQLPSG